MSFLLPLALLLGLTAIFPILAHALRKGRARALPFPAAHLVPSKNSSAKERNRLDDRFLLFLRVLLLLCLALLAASPLAQCSRLSLSRTNGASIFATLIIDDSASMRVRSKNGKTRLSLAVENARTLLSTSQTGDSFAIVLAGYPARILSPPTIDRQSVELALDAIEASDRRTDLSSALSLARSLGSDLNYKDRPIVLLSDLALSPETQLNLKGVVLGAKEFREPFSNCAVIEATPSGSSILVEVSCTDKAAASGRTLELLGQDGSSISAPTDAHDGATMIPLPPALKKKSSELDLSVRLSAPVNADLDQIREDDTSPVLSASARLSIGLRADQSKSGIKTGSGTILRAAIDALDQDLQVRKFSLLPERVDQLDEVSALIIDDPSGFTPETRDTLELWVQAGGVAVLFAGPGVQKAPLGSKFSPFVSGAPSWSPNPSPGVDSTISGSLGPLSTSWSDLNAKHRVQITVDKFDQVKARWEDGQALVTERLSGRGAFITIGLPSSVDQSDLALRPAFIELLDYVVTQAALRRGAQATPVGQRWLVSKGTRVEGPDGAPLNILSELSSTRPKDAVAPEAALFVEASIAGRYQIITPGAQQKASYRYAMRNSSEHTRQPNPHLKGQMKEKTGAALAKVDISRQIALLALVLGVLELAFRTFRRFRAGRQVLPHSISS